jgi:hypothetical protein
MSDQENHGYENGAYIHNEDQDNDPKLSEPPSPDTSTITQQPQPQPVDFFYAGVRVTNELGRPSDQSYFEKLRSVNRVFFRVGDSLRRVDIARCEIQIQNENGQNIYSVEVELGGRPFDPDKYIRADHGGFNRRITDVHDAIGASQNLDAIARSKIWYNFRDSETNQNVIHVKKEKGTMMVTSYGQPIGQIVEDKWYKTPNFTAILTSSTEISSSFLIRSSIGCFALNWLSCFTEGDFKISSSGTQAGRMCNNLASDNTEQFSIAFGQNMDENSKGLLLAAGVMVYIAHFGETGCSGSSGRSGAFCFSGFL